MRLILPLLQISCSWMLLVSSAAAADFKFIREISPGADEQEIILSEASKIWRYSEVANVEASQNVKKLVIESLQGEILETHIDHLYTAQTPVASGNGFPLSDNASGDLLKVFPGLTPESASNYSTMSLRAEQPNGTIVSGFSSLRPFPSFRRQTTSLAEDDGIVLFNALSSGIPTDFELIFSDRNDALGDRTILHNPLKTEAVKFPVQSFGSPYLQLVQALNNHKALVFFDYVNRFFGVSSASGFYILDRDGTYASVAEGAANYLVRGLDGGAYLHSFKEGVNLGVPIHCTAAGQCSVGSRLLTTDGTLIYANDFGDQFYRTSDFGDLQYASSDATPLPLKCRLQPNQVDARESTRYFSSINAHGDLVMSNPRRSALDSLLIYERVADTIPDRNFCPKISISTSSTCKNLFSSNSKGLTQRRTLSRRTQCEFTVTIKDAATSMPVARSLVSFVGSSKRANTNSKGVAKVILSIPNGRKNRDQIILVKFPNNRYWTSERTIDLR